MAKDPAVLWYSNDFISGTYTMTDEQVGKYVRLLCLQQQNGHLTENDMKYICKTYDKVIYTKFIKEGGIYYNKRMRDEADKRKNYSESRKKNRLGIKNDIISTSYVKHMEDIDINVNVINNKDEIKKLWISTFGKNPSLPEIDQTNLLLERFGYKKTYRIMYQGKLDGFHKIKTLINSLDESGNIKPKESNERKPRGTVDKEKWERELATIEGYKTKN